MNLMPRKMKYIELVVLKNDINTVLEYLGRKGVVQFPGKDDTGENPDITRIRDILSKLNQVAAFLKLEISSDAAGDFLLPWKNKEEFNEKISSIEKIFAVFLDIKKRGEKAEQEKRSLQDTIAEVKAFSRMNVPFSNLEHLSYLTLRLGRLESRHYSALRDELGDRAVIIPLLDDGSAHINFKVDTGGRNTPGSREYPGKAPYKNKIFAASSKKGRFALDSALKKYSFEPIPVPDSLKGIPSEMIAACEQQLLMIENELQEIDAEKENECEKYAAVIKQFIAEWNNALIIEELKSSFTETENLYHFTGWTPAENAKEIAADLMKLTSGRIAFNTYSPDEVPSVKDGSEKVPVAMKHGSFVKGFESVVFSYGAPLYGTIDPTPLVAFFFTILFGIMFGDIGHGFTLFLAGLLISKFPKKLGRFSKFSVPLISIGISSMVFGLLIGSIFTNESLLIPATRAITGAITGNPVNRIIAIMPLAELDGSLSKLLYFFGFTVAIGAILISIGLIINIINNYILKNYEKAFFSKSGLSGLLLFWYALFIAVHMLLGVPFAWFDIIGLLIPVFFIFFGPLIWRIIAGKRPVMKHGFMTFFMEGFVEILETISGYVSNTVSFLRVGAFALSHTVLSYIVFRFYEMLTHSSGAAGTITAVFIMILGNAIIIVLEGMIAAIQVVRLQYYEFFNKFFVETGVEFSPFRFHKKK